MSSSEPKPADPPAATVATESQPSATSKLPSPPPSRSGANEETKPEATPDSPTATTPPFSPSSTTPVLAKEKEEEQKEEEEVKEEKKTENAPGKDATKAIGVDTELDFKGNVEVNDDLPTEKDLERVEHMLLLDASGESRPFHELYSGKGVAPRQLIIFVRHFFCGNCQEYLRTLSSSIKPDDLVALEPPTFITVIGCGRPEVIPMYIEATSCPFPVYADPTRKLYDYLGMTRTLEMGKKPSYIQSNTFFTSLQSIAQGIKSTTNALKGGDFKQVGGEFLFEHGQCTWAHRMRNTRDHAEVEDIRKVLGLEDAKTPVRKRWSHSIKAVKEKQRSSTWSRSKSTNKTGSPKNDSEKTTPESAGMEEGIGKLNVRPTV